MKRWYFPMILKSWKVWKHVKYCHELFWIQWKKGISISFTKKLKWNLTSPNHSYDILGAGMLWKPKEARILTNAECFDKVLYHVNSRISLLCSKHMWNLKFSTQFNDVQAFHILPKNEIWIKIIWKFYIKKSRYLTKFQLGLQVSWTIMSIYVGFFFFFHLELFLTIFFYHTLAILKLSWLNIWETRPMDETSNDCGWIFMSFSK
jgi:hypothetical protein